MNINGVGGIIVIVMIICKPVQIAYAYTSYWCVQYYTVKKFYSNPDSNFILYYVKTFISDKSLKQRAALGRMYNIYVL